SDCGACLVASAEVYLQDFSTVQALPGPQQGCGKNVSAGQVGAISGTTGGASPLSNGDLIPAGCGAHQDYTYRLTYTGPDTQFRGTIEVMLGNDPQHLSTFTFKVCQTFNC